MSKLTSTFDLKKRLLRHHR